MLIKVCGLREAENIKAVDDLGVDMTGFIFAPQSKRYVEMISSCAGTMPDYSEARLKALKNQQMTNEQEKPADAQETHPKRVGVFVDDVPQNIITRIYNYALDYVQLHGEESVVMIKNLKESVADGIAPNLKIIKAISISSAANFETCAQYEGVADMLLFDTKCDTRGGSGRQFDWSLLNHYHGTTPFLLSGGIGPDDAEAILQIDHPMFAGVDLNSRFETAPGVKDVEMLRGFIEKIKKC